MTLASMATIAAAAWGPIWSVIGLGLVWSAANSGSSTLAVSLIPSQVVRFGKRHVGEYLRILVGLSLTLVLVRDDQVETIYAVLGWWPIRWRVRGAS